MGEVILYKSLNQKSALINSIQLSALQYLEVESFSIVGSYADPQSQALSRDIDLVLVLRNVDETSLFFWQAYLNELCTAFSSQKIIFQPSFLEGPVWSENGTRTGSATFIHVLLCTLSDSEKWPSQVKRAWLAQHIDIFGKIKNYLGSPKINLEEYLNNKFGFLGLSSAIKSKSIFVGNWQNGKRIDFEIKLDRSVRLMNFSIYAIVKSAPNILDCYLFPDFYHKWNGSNKSLVTLFLNKAPKDIGQIYLQALETLPTLKLPNYFISDEMAFAWGQKAISFLENIALLTNQKVVV
jgi:hypothetical protein